MKTMKTLVAILCATLTIGLTSCTKDAEDLIIGSWQMIDATTTTTYNGSTHTRSETPDEGESYVITFNKDNTMTLTETYVENGSTHTYTSNGTYSIVNDNTLTLTYDGDSQVMTIAEISRKEMTLSATDSETYAGNTYTTTININFKKV